VRAMAVASPRFPARDSSLLIAALFLTSPGTGPGNSALHRERHHTNLYYLFNFPATIAPTPAKIIAALT
jgi:hypothetical protein